MTDQNANTNTDTNNGASTPTLEEIMAQLEAEKAERAKLKNSLDSALKEKGEITKQLRAKQTAEETEAQERAEAERVREEKYAEMENKYNRMVASQAYVNTIDGKSIDKLIDAIASADHVAIAKIISDAVAKGVNDYKTAEMKNEGQISRGSGKALSKADIMAIKDAEERQKAIVENIHLFKN